MPGIRGDFSKLGHLAAGLRGMKEGVVELKKDLALETLALVQQGFDRSIDPNDHPWLPLKYRKGRPLRLTGRLMNSFTAAPTPRGVTVGTNVEYASFHQGGSHVAPHSRTKGRFQAIDARGKFRSHKTAWKLKGRSVRVRFLGPATFANGITIPARPMIPNGPPGVRWMAGLQRVAKDWMKRQVVAQARGYMGLRDIFTALDVPLKAAGPTGLQTFFGAEHEVKQGAPPRIVWVPVDDEWGAPQQSKKDVAGADATNPRHLFLLTTHVRIRFWSQPEYEDVFALVQTFVRELYKLPVYGGRTFRPMRGVWDPANAQLDRYGRSYHLFVDFGVPVTEAPAVTKTVVDFTQSPGMTFLTPPPAGHTEST